MSYTSFQTNSVENVEAMMLRHFKHEPFHNLHLLYGSHLQEILGGGTCSDKTLSFVADAKQAGFDAKLHSGFINGQEIHRLARVDIDGYTYFADVGNGWPSIKLYPSTSEISFSSFGMYYRTEIHGSRLLVFHEKQGREALQLEIELKNKPEDKILADIKSRYSSGIIYPFSNSLRFSLVVDDSFLFMRGNRLEIYHSSKFESIDNLNQADIPSVLLHRFGINVGSLCRVPKIAADHREVKLIR